MIVENAKEKIIKALLKIENGRTWSFCKERYIWIGEIHKCLMFQSLLFKYKVAKGVWRCPRCHIYSFSIELLLEIQFWFSLLDSQEFTHSNSHTLSHTHKYIYRSFVICRLLPPIKGWHNKVQARCAPSIQASRWMAAARLWSSTDRMECVVVT